MTNVLTYIKANVAQLCSTAVVGAIIGIILYIKFKDKLKQRLENIIIAISFLVAVLCLIVSITCNEQVISIAVLSFYSSFIFSWLLTKQSSKEEFKDRQHEIGKTAWRHIGDVKKATLVTKNRLIELKGKKEIVSTDIDGILDDIEIILQCIITNEGDWQDMISKEYLDRLKEKEDPERSNGNEVTQPEQDKINTLKENFLPNQKQSGDKKPNNEVDEDKKNS